MSKMRKFNFYENYHMALTQLDDDMAGRIIKAVGTYMFDDTEPTLTGIDDAVFTAMRMQLDISKRRSAAVKHSENRWNERAVKKEWAK